MLQNAAFDQDLHCLPLIQQFLEMGSERELCKFYDKYRKELRCLNTEGTYSMVKGISFYSCTGWPEYSLFRCEVEVVFSKQVSSEHHTKTIRYNWIHNEAVLGLTNVSECCIPYLL